MSLVLVEFHAVKLGAGEPEVGGGLRTTAFVAALVAAFDAVFAATLSNFFAACWLTPKTGCRGAGDRDQRYADIHRNRSGGDDCARGANRCGIVALKHLYDFFGSRIGIPVADPHEVFPGIGAAFGNGSCYVARCIFGDELRFQRDGLEGCQRLFQPGRSGGGISIEVGDRRGARLVVHKSNDAGVEVPQICGGWLYWTLSTAIFAEGEAIQIFESWLTSGQAPPALELQAVRNGGGWVDGAQSRL